MPTAVEALGEVANRGVAPRTHRGHDVAHRVHHRRFARVEARRRGRERAGEVTATTEVQAGEHGPVMVTVGLFAADRVAAPESPGRIAEGGERDEAGRMAMSSDAAELSSLRAQLDELTARVVAVGDRYRDTEDSAISGELDHAERALLGAVRSLDRATGMLAG